MKKKRKERRHASNLRNVKTKVKIEFLKLQSMSFLRSIVLISNVAGYSWKRIILYAITPYD